MAKKKPIAKRNTAGNTQKPPTLRQYQGSVAKEVGAAPYGRNPPMSSSEISKTVKTYDKAYGKKSKITRVKKGSKP